MKNLLLPPVSPAYAVLEAKLADLIEDRSPCGLRQILLYGPAGVGKHWLLQKLALTYPRRLHLRDPENLSPLPEGTLTVRISRSARLSDRSLAEIPRLFMRSLTAAEKRELACASVIPGICAAYGENPQEFLRAELLDALFAGLHEAGWHSFTDRLSTLCRHRARLRRNAPPAVDELRELLDTSGATGLPESVPGVTNAMMISSWGGGLARLEALSFPGQGKLEITGAGPETADAARIALARLCVLSGQLDCPLPELRRLDWQINVTGPAGVKDGPSLGWPLLVAMVSQLRGIALEPGLALSGELSLSGEILPVGSLPEKVLGAERFGCTRLSIPACQEKELAGLDRLSPHLELASRDGIALAALGLGRKS